MNIRQEAIRDAVAWGYIDEGDDIPFTCDDCEVKDCCVFAFDLYNTHGDCLLEK